MDIPEAFGVLPKGAGDGCDQPCLGVLLAERLTRQGLDPVAHPEKDLRQPRSIRHNRMVIGDRLGITRSW